MKKLIYILTGFLFLYASESRIKSFGNVKDFVYDPSLTYLYPALLLKFPDILWIEFTDSSLQNLPYISFAGVNMKFEKVGAFSFIYNYPSYFYPHIISYPSKELKESRGFEILWAKNIGEKINIGTGISFVYVNKEIEDTLLLESPKLSIKDIEIMPSLSYSISENKNIDISLHFSLNSFYQEYYTLVIADTIDGKGNSFYGLNLRYVMDLTEYSNFIFGFHFYSYPLKYEERTGATISEFEQKRDEFNINIGYYTEPLENLKIITGLNTNYLKIDTTRIAGVIKRKGSLYASYLNGILGSEMELGKHFEIRGGIRKSLLRSLKDKNYEMSGLKNEIMDQEEFNIELGLSFIKDGFRIDGVLVKDLFFKGPFLISGKESGFFTNLSISYNFSIF
ncbi:MAG: hypothetical protein ABIM29_01480 [candidate division WOR-3 bacterium]